MSVKHKVKVTQQDIDRGLRNECGDCPVALAARRKFGGLTSSDVMVDYTTLWVRDRLWGLPNAVSRWITDFDLKRPVQPMEFELEGEG